MMPASAIEALAAVKSGRLTVREIAEACLARIDLRDPEVHAWAYLDEERVRAEADRLDAMDVRGPLHGVPIGVKDMILTEDMPTRHGSPLYDGARPLLDAAPVMTLRAAGALLIGKTVTTEFASTQRGGPTRNPRDLTRTPGGSSSGSAAAVADGHVPLALGTQTGGSVVRPASFCGVFALKPTWGAISREGLKQYSVTCDTLGVFANSVAELELLADVFDLDDPAPEPFTLEGARIAFCRSPQWERTEPATRDAMAAAEAFIRAAGASVEHLELPDEFNDLLAHHQVVLNHEGRVSFLSEARRWPGALHDEFVGWVENRAAHSYARVCEAYDAGATARPAFDKIASRFHAVITPSVTGEAPAGLASTGDPSLNCLWTFLHVPVVNVPGFTGPAGMPVSLSLTAPRFHDRPLLRVAAAVSEVFSSALAKQAA